MKLSSLFFLISVVSSLVATSSPAQTILVPAGAVWKFLDNGSSPLKWEAVGFDDSAWPSGPAELGYNTDNTEAPEATKVAYGPSTTSKFITTYFRHSFEVPVPSAYYGLKLRLLRDDGAVVYLNGKEIRRDNLPADSSPSTLALTAVAAADESTFFETSISNSLVPGINCLAVEIHQSAPNSSDLSFNLELIGTTTPATPVLTRGPYLQNAFTTPAGNASMTVRWRTDLQTTSKIWYGTTAAPLTTVAEVSGGRTEHELRLSGLVPDTQYFYAVGSDGGALPGKSDGSFFTPPLPGSKGPLRIWVLGDSGTANEDAVKVKNAYEKATGTLYTDLWLMLGDNAYQNGTEDEFQRAVFNIYPEMLRTSPLFSTLGNHDYYTASGAAYFNLHTFPIAGEAGGAASGTEKYYSFDYGNVHFICLDSMSSDRSTTGTMAKWLHADLQSTTQDWIIAFWHHPPYSKGSHDSDNLNGADLPMQEMRTNFLPLLEAGGVDLVLGGHSHSYERSYLIDGHYGRSGTFNPATMIKSPGNGDSNSPYIKPPFLPANKGAVYAVAGSSGKATNWWGGSTALVNPNPHPAMVVSLLKLGSMVLNVSERKLEAEFLTPDLDALGNPMVQDRFIISRENGLTITSPAPDSSFTQPATVYIKAAVKTYDSTVTNVTFYSIDAATGAQTQIGDPDGVEPYEVTWTGMASGNHSLRAVAAYADPTVGPATSEPVAVVIKEPITLPIAPTNLTATAITKNRIDLAWTDNSSNETGFYIDRSTSSNFSKGVTRLMVGGDVKSYSNTGLRAGTVYYFRVQAYNGSGTSNFTATASATTPSR